MVKEKSYIISSHKELDLWLKLWSFGLERMPLVLNIPAKAQKHPGKSPLTSLSLYLQTPAIVSTGLSYQERKQEDVVLGSQPSATELGKGRENEAVKGYMVVDGGGDTMDNQQQR